MRFLGRLPALTRPDRQSEPAVGIRVDSRQSNQASPTRYPIPLGAYLAPDPGQLAASLSLSGSSQSGALPASLIVDKPRAKAARRIRADGSGIALQTDR
jgi:hypothetical protein